MELLLTILAVLLFSLACNLDTIILAMGYAVKGIRVSFLQGLVIAGITTAVTWLSLVLGDVASCVLSEGLSSLLGGVVMVGIGLWFVLDYLRRLGAPPEEAQAPKGASLWGCVSLAAALAVNNAGIGVAAGVSGISPHWAALGNFLITLAALPLGRWLGDRVAGRLLGRYALPLSGLLLIILGAWEALV